MRSLTCLKNYKNVIVTGILFFALTAPVGYLLDLHVLKKIGLLYGISPLPLPFVNMGEGRENFRFKLRYEEYQNGFYVDKTNVLKGEVDQIFSLPHKYILPFIQSTSYGYLVPFKIRRLVLCKYSTFKQSQKIKFIIEYENQNLVTEANCAE